MQPSTVKYSVVGLVEGNFNCSDVLKEVFPIEIWEERITRKLIARFIAKKLDNERNPKLSLKLVYLL